MLSDRAAAARPKGVLEEWINAGGKRRTVLRFGIRDATAHVADIGHRWAARRPTQIDVLGTRPTSGIHRLGARDEHELQIAVMDGLGCLVDLPLGSIAADRRIDRLARG